MKNLNIVSILSLIGTSSVHGFLQQFKNGAAATSSPLADEAFAVFDRAFPNRAEPLKESPLLNIGVPKVDIDGTKYGYVIEQNKYVVTLQFVFLNSARRQFDSEVRGKRRTDISETDAKTTFNELSKLYGAENALEMTKALPVCLTFKRTLFAPALKEYANIFGEEEAKAMMCRNPGLLAVKPVEAARATDQTMQASYLIASTRPFGDVLLSTLAALLLIPAVEAVSGVPIRTTFFSAITGANADDVANVMSKVATPIWNQF